MISPNKYLMSLNNDDFDGKAIEMLSSILEKNTNYNSFLVRKQSDELEYRALACLRRLTIFALRLYPTNVDKDLQYLASTSAVTDFKSKEWYAANVRLGEMQVLEVLKSVASSGTREMMRRIQSKNASIIAEPTMLIRMKACPIELSSALLK